MEVGVDIGRGAGAEAGTHGQGSKRTKVDEEDSGYQGQVLQPSNWGCLDPWGVVVSGLRAG